MQIKTNHAASSIGFRGDADIMLVIYVVEMEVLKRMKNFTLHLTRLKFTE